METWCLQREIERATDRPGVVGEANRRAHLTSLLERAKDDIKNGLLLTLSICTYLENNFLAKVF